MSGWPSAMLLALPAPLIESWQRFAAAATANGVQDYGFTFSYINTHKRALEDQLDNQAYLTVGCQVGACVRKR